MRSLRLWPVMGILSVTAIWCISASANWWAGTLLAHDPLMSHVLGAASVACDVLKAIALFVVMGAIANKRWVVMGVAMVLFVLCTTWSLRSATFFAAEAISDKVAHIETNNTLSLARLQLIDAKNRRAQFLSEQSVTVTGNRLTRREAIAANETSAAEFKSLTSELEGDIASLEKAAKPIKASTDPLADLLSIDKQRMMLATAFFFAMLMELASSTGFWMIARAAARPSMPYPAKQASVPALTPAPLPAEPSEPAVQHAETPDVPEVAPPVTSNVVLVDFADRDARKLREAILDTVEPGEDDERILIATLAQEVSRRLPKAKSVASRSAIVSTLSPALFQIMPHAIKKRAAGQTWVYGVRLRQGIESANG